jgi:AcrR family transcriptional regulator
MPKIVDNEVRRAELTDAAARLIARAGIGAATLRNVATEAGWTTGVVTHYFPDKRTLLLRTFQASLAHRRSRRDLSDPLAALHASLTGALPLEDEQRRHWMVSVAFCAQAAGDDELATAQREAYREHRDYVASLAGAALPTDDPIGLAEQLIASVNGIAVQALFDPESWPADRQRTALDRAVAAIEGAAALAR